MSVSAAPRPYVAGKRRLTMYMSMSWPLETGAELSDFNNRNIALFELRRLLYPKYEWAAGPEHNPGIAGTLDIFLKDYAECQQLLAECSGQPVPYLLRVDKAGELHLLDDELLGDTDTLIILSNDHLKTGQMLFPPEVEALQRWMAREGTCLVVCPHHEVGLTDDPDQREIEHVHHGDVFVGRQERFSGFARSLFAAFDMPVLNRWGLRSARVPGTTEPLPLNVRADLDTRGFLQGVTTLNAHAHLPHFMLTRDDPAEARVLATQLIEPSAPPHPFVETGNKEFNALVWLPPRGERAADVLVLDLTHFLGQFGGKANLQRFWRNLAEL
jgi:hypothetical protein